MDNDRVIPSEAVRSMVSPPQLRWGGVAVFGDGGVMSHNPAAHDPSVGDYADTSPAKLGRRV